MKITHLSRTKQKQLHDAFKSFAGILTGANHLLLVQQTVAAAEASLRCLIQSKLGGCMNKLA